MKFAAVVALFPCAFAFSPSATFVRKASSLAVGSDPNVQFGGNTWQPDSERMGSTDTGDYFPEGYDGASVDFTEGMGGSQAAMGGGGIDGPQLPGMENLGEDAIVQGGIDVAEDIPEGMTFVPMSVPDETVEFQVASSATGEWELMVKPVCMTFEDYFAGFSADSHPSFSISPATGRMDRRGGEPTVLNLKCSPQGASGDLVANLVVNLPEDNSKICYKITAKSM